MADTKDVGAADVGQMPSAGPPTDAERSAPSESQRERPMTRRSSSGGLSAEAVLEKPLVGLDALKERHGTKLSAHGQELARRVLGELHIHKNGGAPASALAQQAAGQLESDSADWWNDTGRAQAEREFADLNDRGTAAPPPGA